MSQITDQSGKIILFSKSSDSAYFLSSQTVKAHKTLVYSIAFDAQDDRIVSSGHGDGYWKTWNVTDGLVLWSVLGHTVQVVSFGATTLKKRNLHTALSFLQQNQTFSL